MHFHHTILKGISFHSIGNTAGGESQWQQRKNTQALDFYEKKLEKIMMRFGIEKKDYNWNCDRYGGWVEFRYKGQIYRFEHTVDNAKKAGINLTYGSDAFAQIVLALEDLARIVERGIYDLQNWVAGMKMLPEKTTLPSFCSVLGP